MKNIISIIIALIVLALPMSGCRSVDDQLREAIEICDKDCPMEVLNGIYIDNFDINEQNVIVNVSIDRNIYGDNTLHDFAVAIGSELVNTFSSSDNSEIVGLVKACRETNRGFLVKVGWSGENIAPAEYQIPANTL